MIAEDRRDIELKCSTCGKELLPNDLGKKWRRCHFCEAPTCFNDIHYLGVRVSGLYTDYIDVVSVCKECYPKDWLKKQP